MINIGIVDDHTMIREGLKMIIEQEPDLRVVAEAGDAAGALAVLEKNNVDVVILDISLPDRNGIELLKDLRRSYKARVLVLSMHPENRYGVRAIQAGALGYMCKDTAGRYLAGAIRTVHSGKMYIPPSLGEVLANNAVMGVGPRPHEDLSDRELEIMVLIASGKTRDEISRKLNLSPATISTYRKRVLDKLGLATSVEIYRYAYENDLID